MPFIGALGNLSVDRIFLFRNLISSTVNKKKEKRLRIQKSKE
jgi:hypothetical protein